MGAGRGMRRPHDRGSPVIDLTVIRAERCRYFREGGKCEMQCLADVKLSAFIGQVQPCFGPTVAKIHERLSNAKCATCPRYQTGQQQRDLL